MKKISIISALLLIFSLFTVLMFESIHAGHQEHCNEENCLVCRVLQIIKGNQKKLDGHTRLNSLFSIVFEDLIISLFIFHFISITPITKKIKLTI